MKRLPTGFQWPFSIIKLTAMVDVMVDRNTILCPDTLTCEDQLLIYSKYKVPEGTSCLSGPYVSSLKKNIYNDIPLHWCAPGNYLSLSCSAVGPNR